MPPATIRGVRSREPGTNVPQQGQGGPGAKPPEADDNAGKRRPIIT